LATQEGEVTAELQQEVLEVADQRIFQVCFGVFVLEAEELQDERVLDLLLGGGLFSRTQVRTSALQHRRLIPREGRPLIELRGDLPIQLPGRPAAAARLRLVEGARFG